MLAPSAYLASAASTSSLTQSLLPTRLQDIADQYISVTLSAWSLNTSNLEPPSIPLSFRQRAWDDPCCRVVADQLLASADDQCERARLLASRTDGSGDWLQALPLPSIGLKLDDAAVRVAAGLRIGAPLVHPHTCVCGSMVAANGRHGLACRKSAGRQSRHSQVNDQILRAFISAGVLATREPNGLCRSDGKRPDGVTSVPWKKGRCLAWDATCPDTYAPSHLQGSSMAVGSAASAAETSKRLKYT